MKDGEVYGASLTPTYSGRAKRAAAPQGIVPTAADNVAPTEHEHFTAKLITTRAGKKVLDFGQNIAGFVSFSAKGKKRQQIRLRMGEILDEQGEFAQSNIQVRKPVKEVEKLGEVFLVATPCGA